MGRVYTVRTVRVFYNKVGKLKYISHLDMNRVVLRMMRRAHIDVWFTEGFNQHPYVNFALPLSLGFESESEAFDFRLNDDMPFDEVLERLKSVAPNGMEITSVAEPVKKFSDIAFADFSITIKGDCLAKLVDFLSQSEIVVEKTTKKGGTKQIDLKQKIVRSSAEMNGGDTQLDITLPAGNNDNVNPTLLLSAFSADLAVKRIVRRRIYDGEMNVFA